MRRLSLLDSLLGEIDAALQTLMPPKSRLSTRVTPAMKVAECALNTSEKKHIAGLMRVNHSGEVCAQALYRGQALTAQLVEVRTQMANAAAEEVDHLAWCEQRLHELESHPSLLNPLWYFGSLMLGMVAGAAGDRWSLGFVAETERQVSQHLQTHLRKLPAQDSKTKCILERMHDDETHHADIAIAAGAAELPDFIKKVMSAVSKLMTHSSYHV
ncbi:2-polyprenyl-3-methyl-6-methoxy-1,4-benzoquinone monooxygenase [Legionella hackeliae]|uniref:3-demethoxyubiquinol 3-hydroxylase n=1 Tax=Legionella hackeliae TaxID=449 RepID=A0A0A8UKE7_LEGHA|nr:2-polyprenyl-3-methyl-6-methoxy-1,4-benzoquinone monooxygenase [Legionella hackeliae]KTD12859.1 ubiquinone biosynthesis protein [Legionella hackeliae]CEK09163.1 2-nonaprenyl-3-methyl-6-methoxy-1,4-benzoquinol hydroxylase [Legionella hackeliae]STX49073.1 ubiquinone biosynthesis protein [Legionella hackeliae]